MKNYISIDIGGTKIKYGLLSEEGKILESRERDTEAIPGGGPHILSLVKEIVRGYIEEKSVEELLGVCLSSTGMVDIGKGEIFGAGPQVPNYVGTAFKREIEESFGLPCEIENDVNCVGLSEGRAGAGTGVESLLCLTVGTGIGACFVLNGEVYHGFSGSACEVGYMHVPGGVYEQQASASALCRKVSTEKGEDWDGKRIFAGARGGDGVCIAAIEEMCDILGMGIANLCFVLNPQRVVLGGGIMQQEDYLYPLVRAAIDKYLVPEISKRTELRFAKNGNLAGMLGAYYHFLYMQEKRRAEK